MELDKFTKEELDELFEASFKVKEIMEDTTIGVISFSTIKSIATISCSCSW